MTGILNIFNKGMRFSHNTPQKDQAVISFSVLREFRLSVASFHTGGDSVLIGTEEIKRDTKQVIRVTLDELEDYLTELRGCLETFKKFESYMKNRFPGDNKKSLAAVTKNFKDEDKAFMSQQSTLERYQSAKDALETYKFFSNICIEGSKTGGQIAKSILFFDKLLKQQA